MFVTDKDFKMPSTVRHAFFGRKGGVSTGIYESLNCAPNSSDNPDHIAKNRARVAESLGVPAKNLWTLHQIHSADCLIVREPFDPYFDRPKADALVTDVAGLALGVLTADCAPVLFYGEKADGSPVIGAAHAGWKGALGGVLESTIGKMVEIGAIRSSICASVGACLARESYEVQSDFVNKFLENNKWNERFFVPQLKKRKTNKFFEGVSYLLWFFNWIDNEDIDWIEKKFQLLLHKNKKDSAYLFDFPDYIVNRLVNSGIQKVSWTGHDTYANESDYFSYRRSTHRNEPDYGRQISTIVIL